MQQQDNHEYPFLYQRQTCHQVQPNQATYQKRQKCQPATYLQDRKSGSAGMPRPISYAVFCLKKKKTKTKTSQTRLTNSTHERRSSSRSTSNEIASKLRYKC